ncbi:MAG: MOSC domain-containing protein [Syntrophomonadaceae bacterium]|nr:MOSC domain-containing protein [Syntrophomonadaceae bacterium]
MGRIVAVCTSINKGERKTNVGKGRLVVDHGLEGDAHAGPWHRQVSLLAMESIRKMQAKGLDVGPGDFAENLTTEGIDLSALPVGTRLRIGERARGEVTQIGKECHDRCAIYYQAGDCVMPREGIFIRVLEEGEVKVGDAIEVIPPIRVGLLTCSDRGSRGEREDQSGALLKELVREIGGEVVSYLVVPDEKEVIIEKLIDMVDYQKIDLVLTIGGTGFSPRDITPEATMTVIQRRAPGLAEAMRMESMKITPRAMLSRGVAGIRRRSLIINLPGSAKAARECFKAIMPALPHGLEILRGDAQECAEEFEH